MRSLLSEARDKPPLYWTVHVSTRVEIITPITLITRKIGNRTTGTAISRKTAEKSKKWKTLDLMPRLSNAEKLGFIWIEWIWVRIWVLHLLCALMWRKERMCATSAYVSRWCIEFFYFRTLTWRGSFCNFLSVLIKMYI